MTESSDKMSTIY